MENVLITGIFGFLGQSLAYKLVDEGYRFDGIDIKTGADVATQEFLWGSTILHNGPKYDYIYHFGSPCSILQFNKNPEYCVQNTLDGFRNVLRVAKYHHAKLIYPSSGNVYGKLPLPHHEYLNPEPTNLYGVCKFQCEQMAIDHTYGSFESTGLRIYAGYGPFEERKGELASVVYQFLNKMMKEESPEIWGDGRQVRDFIYIDDIVTGLMKAMDVNATILNLGSGELTTYNSLIKIINSVLGTNTTPIYKNKPSSYVDKALANTQLMQEILKFTPIKLYQGIKKFSTYLEAI